MKILTSELIKDADLYTIQHEPISSLDLMERAAHILCEAFIKRFPKTFSIKIFAGPGNNGGDALAIARMLGEQGYDVSVFLFNTKNDLSEDCQANRDKLLANKMIRFNEITAQFVPPTLTEKDIIIDGLFGSGLNRPLNGGFAGVVQYINASKSKVVSIDIPSGLMCEDNTYNVRDHIIKADLTYTFQLPKLAYLLADSAPFLGEVEILDIHLSEEGIKNLSSPYFIIEPEDLKGILHQRNKFDHKGIFGHALLIAGKQGMSGSCVLSAKSCLKSGVGLLTVDSASSNRVILQTSVPEAIFISDPNEEHFTMPVPNMENYTALGIGPGLGTDGETSLSMIEQIKQAQLVPIVMDADALNIISNHKSWISQLPKRTILTPHPKEFDRIAGTCNSAYERLVKAKELAIRQQFFIVLKGAYTAIINPNGMCFFNSTGNPGMATGGSGDVLTGIILSLLAQGYGQEEACKLGVYVHGLAGDLAAEELGETSLTASDIIDYLPKAWKKIKTL